MNGSIIGLMVGLVTCATASIFGPVFDNYSSQSLLSVALEYINVQANGQNEKEKAGMSLVDLAYRRAKAVKAVKKALDAGKILKKGKRKSNHSSQKTTSRTEEMRELFQSDISDKKQRRGVGTGKKSKSSFKSKSRYVVIHICLNFYESNSKFTKFTFKHVRKCVLFFKT